MKRNLLRLFATIIFTLVAVGSFANDGVYYVNGNQLVPIHETDIAVKKEILTISLCDDGYARVDVQYEFMNNGSAKTVEMGFEATAPYNAEAPLNKKGGHPFISDFTVTMNGTPLKYSNSIVLTKYDEDCDFVPVDFNKYKPGDEDHLLYDPETDDMVPYAYAYYFKANFNKGLNTVHHTYRYRMSSGVGRTFEVSYWLKPAMRWANRQIDDFTLRIKAENTAKHFLVADSLFSGSSFKVTQGKGKIRKNKFDFDTEFIEIALRDGTVEWHSTNFRPKEDLDICSADMYTSFGENYPFGYFYDRSDTYVPSWKDEAVNKRILRNLPYANRGYVFKDKKLQDYFSKLFWYMPDPQWKMSTNDFTPSELKFIQSK